MNEDNLRRLFRLLKKHSKGENIHLNKDSQMCCFWSIDNPPDVLEATDQLEEIQAEFDINVSEDEAVEMYDMTLQEASDYIQALIIRQIRPA